MRKIIVALIFNWPIISHNAGKQHKGDEMFITNQVVKGKFGFFVVLGYRNVAGERLVQVKPYNKDTGQIGRGEMAIDESCLLAVDEND